MSALSLHIESTDSMIEIVNGKVTRLHLGLRPGIVTTYMADVGVFYHTSLYSAIKS